MAITTALRGTPLLLLPQPRDLHSRCGRFARATLGTAGAAELSVGLSDAVNDLLFPRLHTHSDKVRLSLPLLSGATDPFTYADAVTDLLDV
ncbi:hypothetical protein BCF44_117121 [Kutzneria buriramensis]|uniref:Uncharacterized protein n=2 Tax=Kutzneria buriramensis TaxID=1045776 RepID=A0A3E0GZB9_9PSEU|nr:hypothetical protein BCF44_117121 [Kutzneria buriramensis]